MYLFQMYQSEIINKHNQSILLKVRALQLTPVTTMLALLYNSTQIEILTNQRNSEEGTKRTQGPYIG